MRRLADEDLDLGLFIRRFEENLLALFAAGQLSGTTHVCLGQEYIPVALAPLLRDDFVFSNHRGHGHYLAHCSDPEGLLAELLGRSGGVCNGVGGSQHLRRESFVSTGVQGESLPVAVGVALHYRHAGQPRIAVAYVGDGTWGEGAVYEALNMAQLWRVPLLVVVENNGVAQSTPTEVHLAGSLAGRAAAFGVAYLEIDSVDVEEIRTRLTDPIERIRQLAGPHIVIFNTVRLGPHSKGDDHRPAEHVRTLHERDWLFRYAAAYPDQYNDADARAQSRVAQITDEVIARPPAQWSVG